MQQEQVMTLPKIGCQGCMKKVVRALNEVPTVEILSTDVPSKTVSLRYDKDVVTQEQIATALRTVGHTISNVDVQAEAPEALTAE